MLKRLIYCSVLLLIILAGCEPLGTAEEAIAKDPTLALHQSGDTALSCDALDAEITKRNGQITLAQRMTEIELNHRTSLGAPTNDTRVTDTTVNGHNGPTGIGNGTTAFTSGSNAASNEVLSAQKATATAAIARANELIRLAKLKHCYAT